jgi:hypothetical protein
MTMKRALQVILGISLFGVIFSGVLSYRELFEASEPVCPSPGAPGTIFGYPACVYGFFMYLLVAGTACWGLLAGREKSGRLQARTADREQIDGRAGTKA